MRGSRKTRATSAPALDVPPSTTMTSKSRQVWPSTLPSASAMKADWLQSGTTMENFMPPRQKVVSRKTIIGGDRRRPLPRPTGCCWEPTGD
jgi:hypothetical protein